MDTAKIFQNGQSQAIRLPKEYRFRGTKVYVKRMGNAVVLIPEYDSFQPLLESLDMFSEDFLSDRNRPAMRRLSRDGHVFFYIFNTTEMTSPALRPGTASLGILV